MENKDIVVPVEGVLSFDEFNKKLAELTETNGVIDKTANLYDKIPTYIKALTNFDPTGVSGAIDQALSENKSKRENENIVKALYEFYVAISFIGKKQIILEDTIKSPMIPVKFTTIEIYG